MGYIWETISNHCSKVSILINKSYLLFILVSIVGSTVFTYYYFLYTHEYPPGSTHSIASFQADKVFQTRLLIPSLANFIKPTIPVISICFGWLIPYPVDFQVVLQLINIVFLAGLLISFPHLLACLNAEANHWASLLLLIPITWNYIIINGVVDGAGLFYCYDIPSLTFFVLGLIFFLKEKWAWFYPIFILACLNRESACFLSLSGFILLCNLSALTPKSFFYFNKNLTLHILRQASIWICLRICLSYVFRDNPGLFFEEPHSMLHFLSGLWTGEPHWAMQNTYWFISLFAGIWVIPLILYKYLYSQGRRLALVGFIYLITLFLRSNMMETRVYNELNVIITVCVIASIQARNKIKLVGC